MEGAARSTTQVAVPGAAEQAASRAMRGGAGHTRSRCHGGDAGSCAVGVQLDAAASRMAWALTPLMPKELVPARLCSCMCHQASGGGPSS